MIGWVGGIELQRTATLRELRRRARETQMIPAKYALGVVRFESVGRCTERRGGETERNSQDERGGESDGAIHERTPVGDAGFRPARNYAQRVQRSPETALNRPDYF